MKKEIAYELRLIYKFLKSETRKYVKDDRKEAVCNNRHFLLFKDKQVVIFDGGSFVVFLKLSLRDFSFEKEVALSLRDFLEIGKHLKKDSESSIRLTEKTFIFHIDDLRIERPRSVDFIEYEKLLSVVPLKHTDKEKIADGVCCFNTSVLDRLHTLLSFYGAGFAGFGQGLEMYYSDKRYFMDTKEGFAVLLGLKHNLNMGTDDFEFFKEGL